jgi:acetoin utilization deacetylase AcuC-like enzyme
VRRDGPRVPFGRTYPAGMRVVHSPVHLLHDPVFEVFSGRVGPSCESPARAEAIRVALEADPAFSLELPTEHGLAPALAVHEPGLVRFLEEAWDAWRDTGGTAAGDAARSGAAGDAARSGAAGDAARGGAAVSATESGGGGKAAAGFMADTFLHPGLRGGAAAAREPVAPGGRIGYWCFDTATPITAGAWPAARAAVDVALTAADAVLAGERVAYGICRPPGHHAGRAVFGGYCYLNNAAIAAEHLVRAGAGRVGILDVDFHHGNGTQEVFWERGDVPYASLHGDPDRAYPYFTGRADETGGGKGAGATFNQPLPAGTGDAAYLAALERALNWLGGRHDGVIVVSLGIDTYGGDPICDFALTTPAYFDVGRRVAAAGARLVVLQEGGYHLGDLGENVRQWLRGAAGLDPEPATPG